MGGVDQHDWFAGKYSISIRGKKWYWSSFNRLLDMVAVNAWIINKFLHETDNMKLSLLDFKRELYVAYLKRAVDRV